MECLFRFIFNHFASHRPPYPSCGIPAGKKRIWRVRPKVNGENDPLLQSASDNAILRYLETHRPEPHFVDPYVSCLVNPSKKIDALDWTHHHCLATKFIDDQLLSATSDVDVPKESIYIQQELYRRGFNGNRPSIWALQGLPLTTLASLEDVLFNVSSLAMKGSILVGESPAWFARAEFGTKSSRDGWVDKVFLSHGFRINVIAYKEIARSLDRELPFRDPYRIVFSREH